MALGFTFEGSTQDSDWCLADVHVTGLEPTDLLHIFWHRDGILAFFPITPGRWRVIADLGPATGSGHHPDPTLEEIQAMVAHRGNPGITLSDPIWLAAFRINERKVKDYSRGRVFLAGDAAHIHSPAGGQGMNTGMQDAFNLAWKLDLVIKGIAKPSLLDSYSTERSAVGDMVLRNAGRMTEAAIARNPVIQSLRNTMVKFALSFPQIGHVMADTLSELNIAYPESPLVGRRRPSRARRQARASLARAAAGGHRQVALHRHRSGRRRRRSRGEVPQPRQAADGVQARPMRATSSWSVPMAMSALPGRRPIAPGQRRICAGSRPRRGIVVAPEGELVANVPVEELALRDGRLHRGIGLGRHLAVGVAALRLEDDVELAPCRIVTVGPDD